MIIITRQQLLHLWLDSGPRRVPVDVMVTSAEMEDNPKSPWGTSDVLSERYEKASHERAVADPERWGKYGLTAEDWTSYGIFQMMGFTFRENGFFHAVSMHERVKCGEFPPVDYVLVCMAAYDQHMGKLIRRYRLPKAFRRYNGSGEQADAYLQKALGYWERVKRELNL